MRKRVLSLIGIVLIVIAAIIIVLTFFSRNQNSISKDEKLETIISDMDLSVYDKTKKISDLIAAKEVECDTIKKQIIDAITNQYNSSSLILSDKFSKDDAINSFEKYYESSMDRITQKVDFSKYIYYIEYSSGSYASVEIAASEYKSINDFYIELLDILDQLKT